MSRTTHKKDNKKTKNTPSSGFVGGRTPPLRWRWHVQTPSAALAPLSQRGAVFYACSPSTFPLLWRVPTNRVTVGAGSAHPKKRGINKLSLLVKRGNARERCLRQQCEISIVCDDNAKLALFATTGKFVQTNAEANLFALC